ncbi:MAG: hypothetical protein H0U74_13930 [Bradymonadaceae bacterium]|nr:hypothetical protein [Lujinxingiaceae bacterium]
MRNTWYPRTVPLRTAYWAVIFAASMTLACVPSADETAAVEPGFQDGEGKGDQFDSQRTYEVLLTEPFCDTCTNADKTYLQANSAIIARVIEMIDAATISVDVAQFTFSVREIEDAMYRAKARGIKVRLAIDSGQNRDGSLARRMATNGVDVRFVKGADIGGNNRFGLLHSKFMIVDGRALLSGSNNWSSTGITINEENTIVVRSVTNDPLIKAFGCHFDAIWASNTGASGECSTDDARFSPSSAGRTLLRDGIRASRTSVDVLMHHLLFDDLIKELAVAAERGVRVRIIMNVEDRHAYTGPSWNRFHAAGGEIRYKQNNADAFQIMHNKLAVVDNKTLLHGSGNWSGSGFFNNYEFYVRYRNQAVVTPFVGLFARLWDWSLSPQALDEGWSAARQHHGANTVYFGNLHAHFEESVEGKSWDDGELKRSDVLGGELFSVLDELAGRPAARYAYEYARDQGKMDFMALSPHVVDDRASDAANHPNISELGFEQLIATSRAVSRESAGRFVAIPAAEWNTNSAGNHINIFGTDVLCKVERDRFDVLYGEFLSERVDNGERPLLQFNHPRTFRRHDEGLLGNWDQIFDVNLLEITRAAERRQKFNDFGLDDYPPMSEVRNSWILGEAVPSREVVSQTLFNLDQATRPYLRLMEVTIGRGTEIAHENAQNPSWVQRGEEMERFTRVQSDWEYYLLHGFRMAPAANHDNHYANWGTGHSSRTAIIAPTLSEQSLLTAIDRRQVYASEDENLAIGFYAGGRVAMGGELSTLSDHVSVKFHFSDPDYDGPFEVRVYRGTVGQESVEEIAHLTGAAEGQWIEQRVSLPTKGTHFIYIDVNETGVERMAWTAPIWVERL